MQSVFFFNDTATTEIYTLSLHDALPIYPPPAREPALRAHGARVGDAAGRGPRAVRGGAGEPVLRVHERRFARALRSEEHTSELQSRQYLVCRLLLEKKIHCATTVFLILS